MTTCPHCGLVHGAKNHFCPVTGHPVELGPRLISESLLDRYRVITVMSEGSVGIVLEVEDQKDRERYTAKVIHPRFTRSCPQAESYFSDIRALQAINSPHIAKVVAAGKDSGAAFTVVREYLEGRTLRQRLADGHKPSMTEAVRLARQILLAAQEVQSAGVSVVDFSMGDVFLVPTQRGEIVKLLDLGEYHFKLFVPADVADLGSRRYRAPELGPAQDIRKLGEGAAVYAVGAMLYEMLTGTTPESTPAPLDSFVPGVLTEELAAIIHRSVAADPKDRFSSLGAFCEQLETQLPGVEGKAKRTSGVPGQKTRSVEGANEDAPSQEGESRGPSVIVDMPEIAEQGLRRSKVTWIAGLAVLLLAALGGLAVWGFGSEDPSAPQSKMREKIEIRVETIPPNAAVSFDGKRVDGYPAVIELVPDGELHTISAKAKGFEPMEKDMKLEQTQTVTLELVEIVQPDSSDQERAVLDEPADEVYDEIGQAAGGDSEQAQANRQIRDKTKPKVSVDAKTANKRGALKGKKVEPQRKKKNGKRKRPAKTRDGFSKDNPFD